MRDQDDQRGLPLLLFSQDRRLAQTRQWLLEQAHFQVAMVDSLADFDAVGSASSFAVFLLCNSLSAELRAEAVARVRSHWPAAKILMFEPTYPLPELPVDKLFVPLDGPDKLIRTVRSLTLHDRSFAH